MAQSHTWSIRGRRDLLSWDPVAGTSSSSGTNRQTIRPRTPPSGDVVYPEDHCAWCGQSEIGEGSVRGQVMDGQERGSSGSQVFCSDVCFSQCRRAAFKRAKVCDWCKHVRHTVTYVDLHDGQRQLQFCTDKCRNQYKMQLFCAEASSLGVQSCAASTASFSNSAASSVEKTTPPSRSGSTSSSINHSDLLITPALWLSDCSQPDDNATAHHESDEADPPTDELALVSVDSDSEERGGESDTPLNLVRRHRNSNGTGMAIKRKSSLVEVTKSSSSGPVSKKGKSHRKPHHPSRSSGFQQHLPPPPPPNYFPPSVPPNNWPAYPYPPLAHPYVLQSQFLPLNQSLKRASPTRRMEDPPAIAAPSVIETASESEASESSSGRHTDSETVILPDKDDNNKRSQLDVKGNKPRIVLPDGAVPAVMPPNFVVLRVPVLVPLPIPVPIPIPLNIHEKYIKQLLA